MAENTDTLSVYEPNVFGRIEIMYDANPIATLLIAPLSSMTFETVDQLFLISTKLCSDVGIMDGARHLSGAFPEGTEVQDAGIMTAVNFGTWGMASAETSVANRLAQASSVMIADEVVTTASNRIHHIASNKHFTKYTSQFEAIADKYGLGLDEAWNKVDVSSTYHYSKHPNQYHEFVLNGMRAADVGAAGNQAKFLELFNQYVKQPLLENPNILNKTGW